MTAMGDARLDVVLLADTVRPTTDGPAVQAIAVRDGVVIATGTRADAAGWPTARAVHDFGAATIVPGLIDAHSHAVSAGVSRRGVDLSPCTSLDDVARVLAEQPHDHDSPWALGWSLDPNLFGHDAPSNHFLESLGSRPTVAKMADGHSAIANPAALAAGGVTGREVFGSNSAVVCNAEGLPTGLLLESAALRLVMDRIPPLSQAAQAASLLSLLTSMSRTGLTALSLLDLDVASLDVLEELEQRGELPLRLRSSPVFDPGANPDVELARVSDLQSRRGRRWIVEGVKFVLDGTIDNGTAWLLDPDTFGDSTRSLWLDPSRFRAALHALAERGISTATHAIGDAAIAEAIASIAAMSPAQRAMAPHRVEHVETMPDDLLQEFTRSGALAGMQPTHSTLYVWPDHQDEWSRRLGPQRARVNGFRLRELIDAGVTVALGSDFPVAPYDPRGVLADAQLRRPHDRPDRGRTFPRQALTAQMALEGYTRSAARALGWHGRLGTLEPGMIADAAIFEHDPLRTSPEILATSRVLATVVDGSVTVHP